METSEKTLIKQFKGEGFDYWKFRVETFLEMKNVKESLSEEKPTAADQLAAFEKRDKIARHYLVSLIGDEYLEVVREKETAKQMWDAMNTQFGKTGVASQHLLRRKLNNLRMNENEKMKDYFNRFDEIVRVLKSSGAKLEDNEVISYLTINLPESYDPLITALENINNLTLEVVKTRLLIEEDKRLVRGGSSSEARSEREVAAMAKRRQTVDVSRIKCFNYGEKGHYASNCPDKDEVPRAKSTSSALLASW